MGKKVIPESITFGGLKYNLDDRDKVAANAVISAVDFTQLPTTEPSDSGSLWVSGSTSADLAGNHKSGVIMVSGHRGQQS